MSANVVQLDRLFRRSWDWAPSEVAEFYRVESALIQAGLKIDTERGVSDEGDPWFAFCRPDDGEVIVHIARIGGLYVLAGPSYEGVSTGRDIASLVRDLVGRHPLIQTRGNNAAPRSNIFMHPAALLIAVVATAFFKSTEARALTDDHKSGDGRIGGSGTATAGGGSGATVRPEPVLASEIQKTVVMDAVQSAVILSAIAAVLQTPTTPAPQQTVTNAVVASSELSDFGGLAVPAPHAIGSMPVPAGYENQGMAIQTHSVTHPIGVVVLPIATTSFTAAAPVETLLARHAGVDAPPVAGDALPLVAVLWDLPVSHAPEKAVVHEVNAAPAAPTVNMAPAAVQSPVATFKLALTSQPNESMPVVQAAKIAPSGTQSAVDSQPVSGFGELSKALANLLKDSAHTKIDAPSVSPTTTSGDDPTTGSVASALIHLPSDQPGGSKVVAATASALSLLPAAISVTTETAKTTSSSAEANKATSSSAEATKATSSSAEANKATSSIVEVAKAASSTVEPAKPTESNVGAPAPTNQIADKLDPHSTATPPHLVEDVSALVQDFFAHTPSWSQAGTGKQIVLYDTVALSTQTGDLVSVTFDFFDGSTLSLLGLPAALPHWLVA